MSTIVTSNVSDGTLSIPTTFVTNGSAKAWASFVGTGTASVEDSFNVSSLTDQGTGDYTLNFTNSMSNANFSVSTGYNSNGTNFYDIVSSRATGNVRVVGVVWGVAFYDVTQYSVSISGDLA
jgi:hypothetical protein